MMNKDWKYFEITEEKCEEWQLAQVSFDLNGKPLNRVYVLLVAEIAAYVKWDGCVSIQEYSDEPGTDRLDLKHYSEKLHVCDLQGLIDELQDLEKLAAAEVYR